MPSRNLNGLESFLNSLIFGYLLTTASSQSILLKDEVLVIRGHTGIADQHAAMPQGGFDGRNRLILLIYFAIAKKGGLLHACVNFNVGMAL